MILRSLLVEDEEEAIRAHRALAADAFPFLFDFSPGDDFSQYVTRVDAFNAGGRFSYGGVPGRFLLAEEDGVIVGRLSLRHALNADLRRWGGHVGYCVLPEHRREGHASAMLRRGLSLLEEIDVGPVLVTCDEGNVASRGVIERVGGRYLGACAGPAGPAGPLNRLYQFGPGLIPDGPPLR